ncbi:unnamed protein product, partial [Meganyctiphanes norvegica]
MNLIRHLAKFIGRGPGHHLSPSPGQRMFCAVDLMYINITKLKKTPKVIEGHKRSRKVTKKPPMVTEAHMELYLSFQRNDYFMYLFEYFSTRGVNPTNSTVSIASLTASILSHTFITENNINVIIIMVSAGTARSTHVTPETILNRGKPLIGFNSDPMRSKGQLCLPQKYSVEVKEAIDKLLQGKFRWMYRSRIRVTLTGEDIFQPPIELHDQQLMHPEYRYLDMDSPIQEDAPFCSELGLPKRILPVLALNEVFIGECVSARVSYLELTFDGYKPIKQKCSGFIASTGTGSTSWTYNINKLTEQNMEEILTIVKEDTGFPIKDTDEKFVRKITNTFNQMLITDPEEDRMVYTIRDQLITSPIKEECVKPRGLTKSVLIRSRCFDASLVIDGGLSYSFNDGTRALLEINESDALRTVSLDEEPTEVSFKH